MTTWRWVVRVTIAVGVLLAVIVGVVALRHAAGPDREPRAGDCVRATMGGLPGNAFDRGRLAIADCTDPEGVYEVLGRIDHVPRSGSGADGPPADGPSADAAGRACRSYPRTTATYWNGDAGYLLCLAPNLPGT